MKLSWAGMTATAIVMGAGPVYAAGNLQPDTGGNSQLSAAKRAAALKASAWAALGKGEATRAVQDAEVAAMLLPHDAGIRALLGRAYLSAGRFRSAETAFSDALALDPALPRAAVSRALAQIALGNPDAARESLAKAEGISADADIGLAQALLGDTETARQRLDAAARMPGADPRTRQNLGLAYALEGRWTDAVAVAEQDVPADMMPQRLHRWAMIAQMRTDPAMQVGAILGVLPAEDAGQPAALALATPSTVSPILQPDFEAVTEVAEPLVTKVMPLVAVENGAVVTAIHPKIPSLAVLVATPVAFPAITLPDLMASPEPVGVEQKIATAADSLLTKMETNPGTLPVTNATKPEPGTAAAVVFNAARRSVARWASVPMVASRPVDIVSPALAAVGMTGKTRAHKPIMMLTSQLSFKSVPARSLGGWAVQLGAFSSHGRREIAWGKLGAKASFLSAYAPTGSARKLGKAMLYRLSVSGLPTRKEAVKLCFRIRTAGGACFVRNMRGDEPMRWALRDKISERA